jgi:hypothetical protein
VLSWNSGTPSGQSPGVAGHRAFAAILECLAILLLFALSKRPGVFAPTDPALAERAEADIAVLSEDLRIACLEPFADMAPR